MTAIAWIVALALALPMLFLALEAAAGLAPQPAIDAAAPALPRLIVLVPAHDEAGGIVATVRSVRAQLRDDDDILVVADNCTDATAGLARMAGAIVLERDDPRVAGKAHALAEGRALLRRRPPGIVILLDADCRPEPGALATLARAAIRRDCVVQGRYLLSPPDAATPLVRASSFAFLVKNLVRQRGLQRLGGGALLQGSGIAFPWHVFDAAPLASASLVEDLQLGYDLVLHGLAIRFEDRAGFTSPASAQSATVAQRTRWEHGTLGTAARYLPRLLAAGPRRPAALVLALDLLVPPLALLAALVGTGMLALLLMALLGHAGFGAPAVLLAASALLAGVLLLVWHRLGRALLPARMLVQLPRYLLWKMPIYGRLLTSRQHLWIRTSRAP